MASGVDPSADAGQQLALVEDLLAALSLKHDVGDLVQHLRLAYQRLAEQAREAAVERHRAAEIETSVELLRTISDVLDIRTVFPKVSELANRMLPHDALAMVFVDRDRHFVRQAASPPDFPDPLSVTATTARPSELIIADISTEALPVFDPPDAFTPVIAAGYRAFLSVRVPAREQVIDLAFWSKRAGAFAPRDLPAARRIADYVALSVSHEQLVEAERQAAEAQARAERLEARVQLLSRGARIEDSDPGRGRICGMARRAEEGDPVAETDTTVLVTGESGTGKEVVARFIHRASARSRGPFVALNCAALPEQLLESELFGYERGAFTSAQQAKPGQIELAANGVLFLDEVTEMSLAAQAKFLRVLQEREFQRLGGHSDSEGEHSRDRRDQPRLAEGGGTRRFPRGPVLSAEGVRHRDPAVAGAGRRYSPDRARRCCRTSASRSRGRRRASRGTPGRRCSATPGRATSASSATRSNARPFCAKEGSFGAEHLALEAPGKPRGAVSTDLGTIERDTIAQVLRECRWNRTRAAKRLGLTRTQLYLRLQKYGLEKPAEE